MNRPQQPFVSSFSLSGSYSCMESIEKIINIPGAHMSNVFGQFDSHLKVIEKALSVDVVVRGESVKVIGSESAVTKAARALEQLSALAQNGNTIDEQKVSYTLALLMEDKEGLVSEIDKELICFTLAGKPIKPKTVGQKEYIDKIRDNMIVFGLGPAGTGKTYLAMAMAITAFKKGDVSRIILTRPAIEAGEKLGFLPGDLQSKIDPYLRPLYDALYQIMGAESYQRNADKGLIEVAPLAYMRGRTLDNAFIILDEAQNTTPAQMKMFLTRIGFGSKAIITGDPTQKDLAPPAVSGLDIAMKVLRDIEGIGFAHLTSRDVVRHPLVQKIVEAYEKYEKRENDAAKNRSKGQNRFRDHKQA